MKKNVFILNYAPHYRSPIFTAISENLDIDFFFGDLPGSNIKKIDYSKLDSFKKEFVTKKLGPFFWMKGALELVFSKYENYILTGDPFILSNWLLLFLLKFTNKKSYLWTHGLYGKEVGIKKMIKLLYFKFADHLFVYGNRSKNLLLSEGFLCDKVTVVYNSLDYDAQLAIRKGVLKSNVYKDYFNNDYPVIIYIGRVQKVKRLDLILDAMNLLDKESLYCNFVIVGGTSDAKGFDELISNKGLMGRVWMYGESYDERKNASLLFNADVCVSPGNIGLSGIHSLMFGTPVITSNNFNFQMPEFEVVIDDYNGGFFIENNVTDLGKKISSVLVNEKITKDKCFKVVDSVWNTRNQVRIFKDKLS